MHSGLFGFPGAGTSYGAWNNTDCDICLAIVGSRCCGARYETICRGCVIGRNWSGVLKTSGRVAVMDPYFGLVPVKFLPFTQACLLDVGKALRWPRTSHLAGPATRPDPGGWRNKPAMSGQSRTGM